MNTGLVLIAAEDTIIEPDFVNGGWEKTEKAEFFDFNIDNYRYGSIFVPNSTYKIRKGDRIAQALIKPVERVMFTEVDALGDDDQGTSQFKV